MKRSGQIVGMFLLLLSGLSTKADGSAFGNSPNNGDGFSLVAYNGLSMSGGAVEFTPTQNIDLSSVTVWLSGYTGLYGQSIYASIWDNGGSTPYAPIMSFSSPTHNDGSLAAFTFSNPAINLYNDPSHSTILSANTEYWLIVTAGGQNGTISGASWVSGGTPSGDAIFDAADTYNVYSGSFAASSTVPAFYINNPNSSFINPVPEPSSFALFSIPLLFGMGRLFYNRWKARAESLKPVRVKVNAPSSRKPRF